MCVSHGKVALCFNLQNSLPITVLNGELNLWYVGECILLKKMAVAGLSLPKALAGVESYLEWWWLASLDSITH